MNFCRMNSWRASESDVIAIIRRLDVDADQQITAQEFFEMMDEQQELAKAIHGDPRSLDREDPYFMNTSPTKANQQRSPRKDALSPQRVHQTAYLMHASNVAKNVREGYERNPRESPLRGSPQRVESIR